MKDLLMAPKPNSIQFWHDYFTVTDFARLRG